MKKLAFIGAILALSTSTVLANETSMEGVWKGERRKGYARSEAELIVVDDMFRIRFSGDLKSNLDDCTFTGKMEAGSVRTELTGNNRKNECENAPKVTIVRVDPNTLKIHFSGAKTNSFDFDVFGVTPQIADADLPVTPSNMDILGIAPGTPLNGVKAILESHQISEDTSAGDVVTYRNADGSDVVAVAYGDRLANDGNPGAIGIYRRFMTAEDKRLTIDQMDEALSSKYGEPTIKRTDKRRWFLDNAGKVVTPEQFKTKAERGCYGQSLTKETGVRIDRIAFVIQYDPGCGNRVFVEYDTDVNGRVARTETRLFSNGLAMKAGWAMVRQGYADWLRKEVETFDRRPEAPKL